MARKKKEEVTPVEEAESKTGIKESGSNDIAVKEAEESNEQEPEEVSFPSFFIEDDDLIEIKVDILFDKKTGKLKSVSKSGLINKEDFNVLGFSEETFFFKPATYEQINNYRQRCSSYRRDAGKVLSDPISLRNYLIVWHLKDWTISDRKGKKIELGFAETGALDDASMEMVYKINSTTLDVVITLFEQDMMM
ncbi:MAG: hypothetical protein ACYSWP_07280 [Planctomycetota bacterium]|jgi:hypothetical protein